MQLARTLAAVLATATAAGGCGGEDVRPTTVVRRPSAVATTSSPTPLGPVGVARPVHRALPPLRGCRLDDEAANGGLLSAFVGGGATCVTGRVVLLRVSHWAARRCRRGCPRHVPMARGFSCTSHVIGEADWSVDCWRGRAVVHTRIAG